MKFYVKKQIIHAISSTPCFVLSSFCCFNLAKHQTLEQSSSSASSIPWRHGLLSVAGLLQNFLTAGHPSLASSLSILLCHQNDLSVMDLIVLVLSLKFFMGCSQSSGLKIQVPQYGKSLVEIWSLLTNLLLDLLTILLNVLCTLDILTNCISLNVPCVYTTEI